MLFPCPRLCPCPCAYHAHDVHAHVPFPRPCPPCHAHSHAHVLILYRVIPVPVFLPEFHVGICFDSEIFRSILPTEFREIAQNFAKVKTNSEKVPTTAEFPKTTSVDTLAYGLQYFYLCVFFFDWRLVLSVSL